MNINVLRDFFDYYTILLFLLSVCVSSLILLLASILYREWGKRTNFIESDLSEVLSLLLYPSTYEEGLQRFQQVKGYKYFLPLISVLITQQRSTGVSLRNSFEQLRIAIHKDLQFENRQRVFIKESFGQYLIYIIFSWMFCIFFAYFGIRLENYYYFFMFIFHLLGFALLIYYVSRQQNTLKNIFNAFAPALYQTLVSCNSQISYGQQEENTTKSLKIIIHYHKVLKQLVSRRNSFGVGIYQELQLLSQDFWFTWEELWTQAKFKIERMKFALVMFIFGGSFILIVFGISQKLVAGMFDQNLL